MAHLKSQNNLNSTKIFYIRRNDLVKYSFHFLQRCVFLKEIHLKRNNVTVHLLILRHLYASVLRNCGKLQRSSSENSSEAISCISFVCSYMYFPPVRRDTVIWNIMVSEWRWRRKLHRDSFQRNGRMRRVLLNENVYV